MKFAIRVWYHLLLVFPWWVVAYKVFWILDAFFLRWTSTCIFYAFYTIIMMPFHHNYDASSRSKSLKFLFCRCHHSTLHNHLYLSLLWDWKMKTMEWIGLFILNERFKFHHVIKGIKNWNILSFPLSTSTMKVGVCYQKREFQIINPFDDDLTYFRLFI